MSKVYVFFAEGFEEIEGLTVIDILRRANMETLMVSLSDEKVVLGAHGIEITADIRFQDVNYDEGSAFVLPGGMPGTLNLVAHEGLGSLLDRAYQDQKLLAAICAAPRVLGLRGLLEDKKATCYPGNESFLKGAKVVKDNVVVDGHIITSKGFGTAIDFSLAILAYLQDKDSATKMAETIQYSHYVGL